MPGGITLSTQPFLPATTLQPPTGQPAPRPGLVLDSLTVTELEVEDGDLAERAAPRTSLVLQVSAPVTIELGLAGRFRTCSIGPGDFCVAPAGASIPAARWSGSRRFVLTELSPTLVRSVADSLNLHSFELRPNQAIRDPRISHLLFALREELICGNSSGRAYIDSVAWALATRLLQGHSVVSLPKPQRGGLPRHLLNRVTDFVEENLDQDLGLARLASLCGLSEDHFARAFRESAGVPPHRYLLQRRLARARRLLESTATPIVDIAHALGFSDQSHLTNMFRRHLGLTPGQVRAESSKVDSVPESFNDTGILQ